MTVLVAKVVRCQMKMNANIGPATYFRIAQTQWVVSTVRVSQGTKEMDLNVMISMNVKSHHWQPSVLTILNVAIYLVIMCANVNQVIQGMLQFLAQISTNAWIPRLVVKERNVKTYQEVIGASVLEVLMEIPLENVLILMNADETLVVQVLSVLTHEEVTHAAVPEDTQEIPHLKLVVLMLMNVEDLNHHVEKVLSVSILLVVTTVSAQKDILEIQLLDVLI